MICTDENKYKRKNREREAEMEMQKLEPFKISHKRPKRVSETYLEAEPAMRGMMIFEKAGEIFWRDGEMFQKDGESNTTNNECQQKDMKEWTRWKH